MCRMTIVFFLLNGCYHILIRVLMVSKLTYVDRYSTHNNNSKFVLLILELLKRVY